MANQISFNVPPFRGAVRALLIALVGIFILQSLVLAASRPAYAAITSWFSLIPYTFAHGWLWQVLTFQFLHADTMHLFFNAIGLWMFGSTMESRWGASRFLFFYVLCGIGAGLIFTALAYAQVAGVSPLSILQGASGGIFGLIVAFGVLYAEQEVYLFPFPIALKAKYLVMIILGIAMLSLLRAENAGSAIAHLGGALTGFLLVKFGPQRSPAVSVSEGYYGIRNRYQRWKRRRMARKFEVFMKQHDRRQYFDEYGNFRAPTEAERKRDEEEGKGSGWVN